MDIIKVFNSYTRKLEIYNTMLKRMKKYKYKQIKDLVFAGYEKLKTMEDVTEYELEQLVSILESMGIDIKNEKKCQELIEEYNKKIGKKDPLELELNEMNISKRSFHSLLRSGHSTVLDIIYNNDIMRIRNLGESSLIEIKEKLKEYGIDYEDEPQKKELIEKYNEKCLKNGIISQLEKTIDDMEDEYDVPSIYLASEYKRFRDNKCKTILDIIINRKKFQYEHKALRNFGIDICNENQCKELIDKYYEEKQKNPVSSITNEKEKSQELQENVELQDIIVENETLEKELERKIKALRYLEEQLKKRELLKQQIEQCDREYEELIKKYNETKENNNSHGTK